MTAHMATAQIGNGTAPTTVLGLGCWPFGGGWGAQEDEDSRGAIRAALDAGINHFDTAQGYGSGRSERLVGEVLAPVRNRVFIATKTGANDKPGAMEAAVNVSLERLKTNAIDLYYIHWPRKGVDLRVVMEGLERARAAGKIRAIGVSNFSVQQMKEAQQVGRIDVHQLCYNLFWRFPERELIPFCRQHSIAVVTYSSIAEGMLTGKFGPERPAFPAGDHRAGTVYFDPAVYPHCCAGVERLKAIAQEAGRELVHLAIRWVMSRPGVTTVLVGARRADQVRRNAAAVEGEIPTSVFERMTAVSDDVIKHVPDTGNIFRYYP
jgi:aryl-alcohol dehydrogenase-like predicted oxidoreductase